MIWFLAQIVFWPMCAVVLVIAWLGGLLVKLSAQLMPLVAWLADVGE